MWTGQLGKHPLLDDVVQSLRRRDDAVYVFDSAALDQVQQRARAIESGDELYLLVDDLISFVSYLQQRHWQTAARQLVPLTEAVIDELNQKAKVDGKQFAERAEKTRKDVHAARRAAGQSESLHNVLPDPAAAGVVLRKKK